MKIDEKGEHLLVGRAVDAWGACEDWLDYLFSRILKLEIDIGHTIMASFTAGPKRDLFERVMEYVEMPPNIRAELQAICKEFGRLATQRNRIVHGHWVHLSDGNRFRVGTTKYLRYFDRWRATGKDPQNAIYTDAMMGKFAKDCGALQTRFAKLAKTDDFRMAFPAY